MKDKLFDMQWFEQCMEKKIEEFHTHEKFMIRIHTIFMIQKIYSQVSEKFLNEKICPILVKMADDPVPNIRFNFSKTVESIYKKINNTNKMKVSDALQKIE